MNNTIENSSTFAGTKSRMIKIIKLEQSINVRNKSENKKSVAESIPGKPRLKSERIKSLRMQRNSTMTPIIQKKRIRFKDDFEYFFSSIILFLIPYFLTIISFNLKNFKKNVDKSVVSLYYVLNTTVHAQYDKFHRACEVL